MFEIHIRALELIADYWGSRVDLGTDTHAMSYTGIIQKTAWKAFLGNFEYVRVGSWQNGFFADFYFWAAGFFRGFCRRIFSPHFCGKKCPEKSSRKIPGKILQILYNKNPPTHFCRLAGAKYVLISCLFSSFQRTYIELPKICARACPTGTPATEPALA